MKRNDVILNAKFSLVCFCLKYRVVKKKRKPTFGSHFEILPGGNYFFCDIFGQFRYFYVSGEDIVGKDAKMSLLRLFEQT